MQRFIGLIAGLLFLADLVSAAAPGWVYVRVRPTALPLVQTRTLWLGAHATIERRLLVPEQTIAWQRQQRNAAVAQGDKRTTQIERAEEPLLRTLVVRYDGDLPLSKYCQYLMAENPHVEYAEPVRRQRLHATPNDPLFAEQAYLQTIEAPAAWDITTGAASVLIGVSDSGVRFTHEDLSGALAVNTGEIAGNNIDDDGNGYTDDYRGYNLSWRDDRTAPDNVFHPTDGHGTSVAGIIAAVQNNAKGISGIAPGCRIVPIKATPNSTEGFILFGYESLIYAAVRGCKVVNCSWGNEDQSPSPIEESIVAYAVARDVAIVASAGNGTGAQPMYPAAYPGVLGVGETDVNGSVVPGTGIGAHCKILAPGSNARTTGSLTDADYTYFSGTSSAAPMVSGVVALVRSHFPQLSALQALEHVRLTARDVRSANPDIAALIPGMVNARQALERDPFSTPAIVPIGVRLQRLDGTPVERSEAGDTLQVFFDVVNRLGSGTQLRWSLQIVQSWGSSTDAVEVLDAVVTKPAVTAGEEFTLGPFSIVIQRREPLLHFFRLEVSGQGSSGAQYQDVALLPFYPTPDWVTIRGDSLVLSVGDYGWIGRNTGSGQEHKGYGLTSAALGSLLYGGGVFVVDFSAEKVRSGIEGDALAYENDFVPLSIGATNTRAERILRDTTTSSGAAIGVTLREEFDVIDHATIRIRTSLINTSTEPLHDVAVGYFFDFDLTPAGDSSVVSLLIDRSDVCAEMMERMSGDPVVAALIRTADTSARVQCAGLDAAYARIGYFIPERKMETLRQGTQLQMGGQGDKSIVVGVRYPNTLAPMASRTADVFIVFGRSSAEVRQRVLALASVQQSSTQTSLLMRPHPATGDAATIDCDAIAGQRSWWRLFTLDGHCLWQQQFIATPEQVILPLEALPSGVFMLTVHGDNIQLRQTFLRLR